MSQKDYKVRHKTKKRTRQVKFHVTEEEYTVIKKRAKNFDHSVADTARRAALGVRMAAPPSAENMEQYRIFSEHAGTLNEAVLQAHKMREMLEETELRGETKGGFQEKEWRQMNEILERMNQALERMQPVLFEIKQLLIDQWEENKSALENA